MTRPLLSALAGSALPAALLAFCVLGPALWPADPAAIDAHAVLLPPRLAHPLGTDGLGRDELARLMQGGAATLRVAAPATLLALALGTLYGAAAGLAPRWADAALMRVLDALLALPPLMLLVALAALLELNTLSLALLLAVAAWPPLARLVRNEVAALRRRDYVLAARQMGAGGWYLARAHMLPVIAPVLLVNATLLLGDCIALLSTMGFLGLGVQPPGTDWGQLLQDGLMLIDLRAWWLIAPPGLLITASLLAASRLGRRV